MSIAISLFWVNPSVSPPPSLPTERGMGCLFARNSTVAPPPFSPSISLPLLQLPHSPLPIQTASPNTSIGDRCSFVQFQSPFQTFLIETFFQNNLLIFDRLLMLNL